MFRSILGFAIFAILVWIGVKIALTLVSGLFGIAMAVLTLAAIGFIFYLVLRVVSPGTAAKVRDTIKGKRDIG